MTMSKRVVLFPLAAIVLALTACSEGGGSLSSTTPLTPPAGDGTLGTGFSLGVAINDAGEAIGYTEAAPGAELVAARWSVDAAGATVSAPMPLQPLAGNLFCAAFDVDAAGNVVGQSASGPQQVAVRWAAGANEPVALPPLAPGGNSSAFGITPDGTLIVGEAADGSGLTRAVVWRAGADGAFTAAPQVLPVNAFASGGTLSAFSSASSINSSGWIAGVVDDGAGVSHAVLWRPDAVSGSYLAADLHAGGEVGSAAIAVGAGGQVTGEAELSDGVVAPVMWAEQTVNGATSFARTQLANTGSAQAINDAGSRIVGWVGDDPRASAWAMPDGPSTVFATVSQLYGVNNNQIVVGMKDGKGFVAKIE